jgi:hypothetical protein
MIKSIIRNLSLLFSVIGIVSLVYLTIFFIPDYFKDKRNQKVMNTNRELIENIQSLLLTGHSLSPATIETMISSKELREGINYPYTIDELLIQSEESTISNKFISVEQKDTISTRLHQLRTQIADDPKYASATTNAVSKKKHFFNAEYWQGISFVEWIAAFCGITFSILGVYSLYYKIRLERKSELEELISYEKDNIEDAVRTSIIFDDLIVKALDELKIDHQVIFDKFSKADVHVKTDSGKSIFIKTRYLKNRTDIPTDFYDNLIRLAETNKASGIYLTNLDDKDGTKVFDEFNKKSKSNKIYMIVAETKEEMKAMLVNTVHRIEGKS